MAETESAPVDPPIPVPDVPGADATARGLPRRRDLTLQQRMVVDASAVADLGLRTAVASIVGAAMLPRLAGAALHRNRMHDEDAALGFYIDLAAQQDPLLSFPEIGRAHV